jgi:Reverse transcriptase (RNA-dependent DNA polymerase)
VTPANLNQRQLRELRKLVDFNQIAVETVPNNAESRESVYAVGLFSDIGEPTTVKQALKRPDADKWRESIGDEINNFQKRNAWKLFPMSKLREEGRIPIPTKTVFKIKDEQDGSKRYKTRIVTKGFIAIPGVEYSESCLPVATDCSVRLVLALSLYSLESMINGQLNCTTWTQHS